jgi:hypothetical protein
MRNKNIKWSGLAAIVTVGLVLSSASAFAATSGDVTISGTVAPTLSIALDHSTYSTLDIRAGAAAVVVATATEVCNNDGGYKVAIKSANALAASSATPTLKGTAHSANTVAYSIKYNGADVALDATTGETTALAPAFNTISPSAEAGVQHDVAVTFAGVYKPADTYSDVLTLTISAN